MFTNQYLAYETLSPGMQRLCESLHSVCYGDRHKKYGSSRKEAYAGRSA